MTGFDNPWYAGMIERFSVDTGGEAINDALDGHGRAILAAACIIGTALDGLAEAIRSAGKDVGEASITAVLETMESAPLLARVRQEN